VVASGGASGDVLGPPEVEDQHGALLPRRVVERAVRLRVVEDQNLAGSVVLDLRGGRENRNVMCERHGDVGESKKMYKYWCTKDAPFNFHPKPDRRHQSKERRTKQAMKAHSWGLTSPSTSSPQVPSAGMSRHRWQRST